MEKFDLIVIGGGPGGYETAIEASKEYGMKTALVEARELGGTCLNKGCIPTKTLLHTAEYFQHVTEHGETIGITGGSGIGVDIAKLKERKDSVVADLRNGVAGLLKSAKVTVYYGTGTIANAGTGSYSTQENCAARTGNGTGSGGTVKVALNEGGEEELQADSIIIATGSVPSVPPIPGADLPGVVTSDELLDNDKEIKKLIVIGGGVIGMEFASVYSALGTEVTVIEALDRITANLDKEISRSLAMIAKKARGIDIHTSSMVTSIEQSASGLTVKFTEKEQEQEASGDMVLLAIGRKASTAGLFAGKEAEDATGAAGVELDRGMIKVNDKYETSAPGIYAIGDVIGGIQLAHVATAEGRIALSAINGKEPPVDINVIPSCIYTDPEIASVGISPDDAKAQGLSVITKKYPMSANGKTMLSLQERGFVKVVADEETHKVLGAQLMCARATDMISQFSQAIVNGLTLEEMGRVIYPHPTFSEGIAEAIK